MKAEIIENIRDSKPRDRAADEWFDEEFERQKTRGDKPVLKDMEEMAAALDKAAVPPHEVDDMMAEMMESIHE